MGLPIHKGSSFLKSYHGELHLFAVANDPDDDGYILIVMLSSIKPNRVYDSTCQLQAGDHDFIKHPTYAVYAIAEIVRASTVEAFINSWTDDKCKDDFRPDILQLLIDGFHDSDEIRLEIENYVRAKKIK